MPTFEGKEEWDSFINPFERMARRNDWGPQQKLDRLHESLRGAAASFVYTQPEEVQEDYPQLCRELQHRFGRQDPPSTARQKLGELRQGKEAVEEYAERVRRLVSRAYPEVPLATQEELAAEAFLRGYKSPRVAYQAMNREPATLSAALTLVDTYEHNYKATMGRDVLVASTLVCMEPRVPVRIANFSDGEVQLRAGLLVGDLMETESAMAAPRQEPRREVDSGATQGASQVHKLDPLELPEHLQDLYSRATENIGADDAGKLAEVLSSYEDVFACDEMDLGHFSAVKHRICTGGARPVRQPVRRTPLGFETEEEGHLRKMLDAGIVEPSQSEWASPVVLVRKKDGGVRWCIDYRRLNAVTEKDAYPLPKIDEWLDTLSGATLFSTLDLQAGYWQVEITPEDKELQAYLGLCNYYRRFVPGFASIAGPLNRLLVKGAEFKWERPQQQAFEELKQRLASSPILAYPRRTGTFILDTDASDTSIGAVLSQEQEGSERVIAYASVQLEPAHQRYCVTRWELLAVVRFTRMFRHYLLGRRFDLRTDHSSLTWLFHFKAPQGQLARWLEELSQYDFTIVHRAGRKHANADAISRLSTDDPDVGDCYRAGQELSSLPCQGCSYCAKVHEQWCRFDTEVDYVVPLAVRHVAVRASTQETENRQENEDWLMHYTPTELREAQKADPCLRTLHRWKAKGKPDRQSMSLEGAELKKYWLCWPQVTDKQDVLYYRWEEADGQCGLKLLVPMQLREALLRHVHDIPTGGHPGVERALARLKQKYYWYGMRKDVELYVARCAESAAGKKEVRRRRAELQQCHAGSPMERVHIDILGPFPESEQGNKYVLVVVDQFTKWVEAYALPDQGAETTARALVFEFIVRYGAPLTIHTDQGRNFESELFRRICSLFEVTKTRTTPYHPASNGQVERFNQTVLQMLRSYVRQDQRDWDVYLPLVTAAYRAAPHASTGFTPNHMMFGREVRMPGDMVMDESSNEPDASTPDYVAGLTEHLARIEELAREHLREAQRRQKRGHDLYAHAELYERGDLVYVRDHRRRKGISPKLQKGWIGPAIIIERLGTVLYRIQEKRKVRVMHHDQLKPYHSTDVPLWVSRFRATMDQHPSVSSTDIPAVDTPCQASLDRSVQTHTSSASEPPVTPGGIQQKSTMCESGANTDAQPDCLYGDRAKHSTETGATRCGRKVRRPARYRTM